MIIQFPNNISQAEQSVKRVNDDAVAAMSRPPLGGINEARRPSPEQVKTAADDIRRVAQQSNQNLQFEFSMDTDTNKTVVKVVDRQTGELIRQIPTEETLAIARSIDQFQKSLLINQKA